MVLQEPESGWYKQVMTGTVGEWDKKDLTFRPAGTEQKQYITTTVIRWASEYVKYEPSLEDLVYDSPTEYQPGDYVMTRYLDRTVYGIVIRLNEFRNYYLVNGFLFNNARTSCTRKKITVPNRMAQLRGMTKEDRETFARLLWECDVKDVQVALTDDDESYIPSPLEPVID